jgi:3-deoxy-manno-octulosonate cytidylyltransferase (CMP-KDO synthetase)
MKLNGAVIIPARFNSSRLPGKPLLEIEGKPMIQRTFERCVEAVGINKVIVATDSEQIIRSVEAFGGRAEMTASYHKTGTDRIAELNSRLSLDFVVNVQGDEPLINPADIKSVYAKMVSGQFGVLNCFAELSELEVKSPTVPKVAVSRSDRLIYISRGGVPYTKSGAPVPKFKQVCIYGFTKERLQQFARQRSKLPLEEQEDIEILRFLEMDVDVQMLKVNSDSLAVDTIEDLQRVRQMLAARESKT